MKNYTILQKGKIHFSLSKNCEINVRMHKTSSLIDSHAVNCSWTDPEEDLGLPIAKNEALSRAKQKKDNKK